MRTGGRARAGPGARPGSPVGLPACGPPPPPGLAIVERAGCDTAPADPGDPEMARRLHAFVPPELTQAHADLDAALAIAAARPPLVDQAAAGPWLHRQLAAQPPAGVHTVVWHCHLWHQLDQAEQDQIRGALHAAATRFPLTRISCEPDQVGRAGHPDRGVLRVNPPARRGAPRPAARTRPRPPGYDNTKDRDGPGRPTRQDSQFADTR